MDAQGFYHRVPPSHGFDSSPPQPSEIQSSVNRSTNKYLNATKRPHQSQPPKELGSRTSRPRNTNYNMSNDARWKTRSQVEVMLTRVPITFNTWDIYRLVERYGNVIRVDIVKRIHNGLKAAFVTFRPPPNTPFWEINRSLGLIDARLANDKPTSTVPSLLNKSDQFPEQLTHNARSIEFGHMISDSTMMVMYKSGEQNIEFSLDLRRRNINVNFHIYRTLGDQTCNLGMYRLKIKLEKIPCIFFEREADCEILTIPAESPPELYRKTSNLKQTHQAGSRIWTEWDALTRQTDVVINRDSLRERPTGIRKDQAVIDIGRWTTYRIILAAPEDPNGVSEQIRRILSSFNVQVVHRNTKVVPRHQIEFWDLLEPRYSKNTGGDYEYSSQLEAMMSEEFYHFSFETRYQLEVCLTHGWLHEVNITREFLSKLQALDRNECSLAVGVLERVASLKRRFFEPMDIFNLRVSSSEVAGTRKPPRYCTVARYAVVTPSMVYFNTPAIEISNRVIRQWSALSDRFLRVRFSDELSDGSIISLDGPKQNEIYARIKQVLRNGIILGDRKFEFLAFGNSQFRDRGAYFFAPTDKTSCQDIRDELGEMSAADQKIPAKFCARLGQNFSTTRGLSVRVTLKTYSSNDRKTLVLPDVKRNGYIFTDGVGKISPFLMKMIAGEFGLPVDHPPSVIQFRLGGCKGVLAVDPKLSKSEIHLRPSQYKFAAVHENLEVIRTSTYTSASLNRQIILVLSTLGVPDSVFIGKMKNQLESLDQALIDEKLAVKELEKAVDINQNTLALASMVLSGFMESKEPFVMSLLKLWVSWTLKYLKEKAKIPIPKGAFLLGSVDETGQLQGHFNHKCPSESDTQEDCIKKLPEVFCYVDKKRRGIYEVVEGVCVLARNPSLHPGDIRVVRAVDVPELHHLKDTIVFPQTGDRDICNMCSGGDIDGDDYLLIWDEKLIPQEWNHPPMDFTPAKPHTLDRSVTVNDMTDFFVDYMKSDKLALIATRHLALADYADAGVKDDDCKLLAQLHSFAVDYPKSGVPVSIPPHLAKVRWPHFMEKPRSDYVSRKILGQLYDLVERVDFKPDYTSPFDKKILEAFDHEEDLLGKAKEMKCRYDGRLTKIMMQHDIATEFEVWSAFVMKHNKEKKDYTFAEELGTLMEAVKRSFKEECEKEAGGRDPERLHRFVAAMYTVTARQVQGAVAKLEAEAESKSTGVSPVIDPKRMPLMSFPWLFPQALGKIARRDVDIRESLQDTQVTQEHHHAELKIENNKEQGRVDATEGVFSRGHLVNPIGDQQEHLPISASGPLRDIDEHLEMIDKNIKGHGPDHPESSRDMKIKALRTYHDTVKQDIDKTAQSESQAPNNTGVIQAGPNPRNDSPVQADSMMDDRDLLLSYESKYEETMSLGEHDYHGIVSQEAGESPSLNCDVLAVGSREIGLLPYIRNGSMNGLVQVHIDLGDDGDGEV